MQVSLATTRDNSLHFGGSGMLMFIGYAAFFVVVAGCLYFLDAALKNGSD